MRRRSVAVLGLVLSGLLAFRPDRAFSGSPLSNDPSSLAVCEGSVRTAAVRMAGEVRRAVSACLTRGIECLVDGAATEEACCQRAAERCEGDLRKLERARVGFSQYVSNRRCRVIPFADVLAADGLGYEKIVASCAALDPPAVVESLEDLADCIGRLAIAATACSVGTMELPRGADALECTGLTERFLTATGADLATCGIAPAATGTPASPTPTPVRSPTHTPGPTASATPAFATATQTETPRATATLGAATTTSTPSANPSSPTPSVVATVVPTATVTSAVPPTSTPTPSVTSTTAATAVPSETPLPTATPVATTTATATPIRTATATATLTATATRTATPTPMLTPGCGNGVKETGEDCDDGNTSNCDACPSDCRTTRAPVECFSSTVRYTQKIHLVPPPGALLSAGLFCINYPSGVVALPGTGPVPVAGRVSGINALTSLNDFNNAVQFGFVASPGFAETTPVISFDLCAGATAPLPSNFTCVVKNASNQGDSIDPPSLVECTPQ